MSTNPEKLKLQVESSEALCFCVVPKESNTFLLFFSVDMFELDVREDASILSQGTHNFPVINPCLMSNSKLVSGKFVE